MTTTKLVQNCPTRLNSDLAQLESKIALLPAMEQIVGSDGDTSGSELKKLMPDESEISKVKIIIRILKLFEAFSNYFCRQDSDHPQGCTHACYNKVRT